MKRKLLASLLCALALGFSACDDDDDDAIISTNPELSIAGQSYDGYYQVIDGKTGDTTYVQGSVAFDKSDTAYVCYVTATLNGESSAMNFTSTSKANIVQTSNGYSFYLYPTEVDSNNPPIGQYGFNGQIEKSGEVILSFTKSVRKGVRLYETSFLFSNTRFEGQ